MSPRDSKRRWCCQWSCQRNWLSTVLLAGALSVPATAAWARGGSPGNSGTPSGAHTATPKSTPGVTPRSDAPAGYATPTEAPRTMSPRYSNPDYLNPSSAAPAPGGATSPGAAVPNPNAPGSVSGGGSPAPMVAPGK